MKQSRRQENYRLHCNITDIKSLTLLEKGWSSSNIWETTLKNQNSIQEETKRRLNSGNASYYLGQNI
jgi:G:T-mismatch repair DNA endonuclease (very short patch repair protein)